MEGQEGIHGIMFPRQEGFKAETFKVLLPLALASPDLLQERGVLFLLAQIQHDLKIFIVRDQIFKTFLLLIEMGDPLLYCLGPFGLGPKIRLQALLGQAFDFLSICLQTQGEMEFIQLVFMAGDDAL